jgi:hypothetical protein
MRLALFSHEKPKRVTTWKMPSFSLAAPAQMLGSIKKFITSKMPPSHLAALEHALERSKRWVEWDLIMDVLYLLWLGVVSYLGLQQSCLVPRRGLPWMSNVGS